MALTSNIVTPVLCINFVILPIKQTKLTLPEGITCFDSTFDYFIELTRISNDAFTVADDQIACKILGHVMTHWVL